MLAGSAGSEFQGMLSLVIEVFEDCQHTPPAHSDLDCFTRICRKLQVSLSTL